MKLPAWMARLSSLFQKTRLEHELEEDIQEHLQMATEENLRRGMSPREAAEAARRSFGGPEQMKEEFRDQRGIPFLETLGRETRFAFRSCGMLRNRICSTAGARISMPCWANGLAAFCLKLERGSTRLSGRRSKKCRLAGLRIANGQRHKPDG